MKTRYWLCSGWQLDTSIKEHIKQGRLNFCLQQVFLHQVSRLRPRRRHKVSNCHLLSAQLTPLSSGYCWWPWESSSRPPPSRPIMSKVLSGGGTSAGHTIYMPIARRAQSFAGQWHALEFIEFILPILLTFRPSRSPSTAAPDRQPPVFPSHFIHIIPIVLSWIWLTECETVVKVF